MRDMAKTDRRLDRLLRAMRDPSVPSAVRLKAAVEAPPLCHEPSAPVVVSTTGPTMIFADWLKAARARDHGDEGAA